MKIIQTGTPIVGNQKVTCRKCGAILSIQATDLEKTVFDKTVYQYTCPCCLRMQNVARSALNEDVRFDLDHPKK